MCPSESNGAGRPVYLIAGATGIIGRRLARALIADGAEVRALVRDPDRARELLGPEVKLFEADLTEDPDLGAAMDGVELAYFLVHMMGTGDTYAEGERTAAQAFATAARAAGVGRIVYLGGLGADHGGSPHLDSRHMTAEALRELGPPLTYFRAAMIIAPGSESYELLRSISHRLPALPRTDWLSSRTQPIGIRDVIAYLRAAPLVPASAGREIQIGGADVLPHLEVIAQFSRESGQRPATLVPVPDAVASPGMVAAGAASVTSGNPRIARELARGLGGDTKVEDPSGAALFDVRPEALNVAIQRALDEEERAADG